MWILVGHKWKNITISDNLIYTISVQIIILEVVLLLDNSKFVVLNKSHSLVLRIYKMTMNFPKAETFG